MGLVKEFLTRILTDNYFEHKLREDSKKLQIDDLVDYLKIHLIPAEVRVFLNFLIIRIKQLIM